MSTRPIGFEPHGYNPNLNQPSWIARNGCWFIPVIIGFIALPIVCCGGGILWFGSMVAAPRDAAFAVIEIDARVINELGEPIQPGSGTSLKNMQLNNGNGTAEVRFEINGPQGDANVEAKMKAENDVWSVVKIKVTTDSGVEIFFPEDETD